MNFATQLANQGADVGSGFSRTPSFIEAVLGSEVSDATRTTIARATSPSQMAALTLGSPEFQKR
jgi:uncharacterized protein (DUF1800 family)